MKILVRDLIVSRLHEIVLGRLVLLVWSWIVLLLLAILLLNRLDFLESQSIRLRWSLLHFFSLIYIFVSLCVIKLVIIKVPILHIWLLHSLIRIKLICQQWIFWELFHYFIISIVFVVHPIVLFFIFILIQLNLFLLLWILKLLKILLLLTDFLLKVLNIFLFSRWINIIFMDIFNIMVSIFTKVFVINFILSLHIHLISVISLIETILIHKLMALSAWHVWSRLWNWSCSIPQHLIALRMVILLKVPFLAHILVEILFWFHWLHSLLLSWIKYWHLHLLLILLFIIFTVHAERLHSVTGWIIFRWLWSLNSLISRRLIDSEVSLLSRSHFIPVLFDLWAKTWNMVIFFILFNENRLLVYLLDLLLVVIIYVCLFLWSIFILVFIAVILLLWISNIIFIILIHFSHIIVLFLIKLVFVHVSLMLLLNKVLFSLVIIHLLLKMLGSHLAVRSLWACRKIGSIFGWREISVHLKIILFPLLVFKVTVKVLSSFEYFGITNFWNLIQRLNLFLQKMYSLIQFLLLILQNR